MNISFVLGVVFLFCAVTYRSIVAGLLFIVSCIAANFTAFIYMRLMDVGITIDTIPVISLGIGLGVDYGIYVVSRIRDECIEGRELDDAIIIRSAGNRRGRVCYFLGDRSGPRAVDVLSGALS